MKWHRVILPGVGAALLSGGVSARPLPSARLYGQLYIDAEALSAQAPDFSTYVVKVFPANTQTSPLATYTLGQKPEAGEMYALDVPLDTEGPVASGDRVDLWVGEVRALAGWVVTSGTTTRLDLSATLDRPPVITSPGDLSVEEGGTLSVTLVAEDPDGDAITWAGYGLPSGASVSPEGALTYTAGYEDAGTYELTLVATSGSQYDHAVITLTVLDSDRAPVWAPLAPVLMAEGEVLALELVAEDPDGDVVTFLGDDLPARANVDPSGVLRFEPDFSQAGSYTLQLIAASLSARSIQALPITVVHVDRPPTLVVPNPIQAQVGQPLSLRLRGVDPDGDDVVYVGEGLPDGAQLDPTSGQLSWLPGESESGSWPVLFRAKAGGEEATAASVIEVARVDHPPEFVPVAPQSVSVGQTLKLKMEASDPDGDPIEMAALSLPPNASFSDQVLVMTPDKTQNNQHLTAIIQATAGGLSAQTSVIFLVGGTNTEPWLEASFPAEAREGEAINVAFVWGDADNDPVTLKAEGLPQGATFDEVGGIFVWTPDHSQAGEHAMSFLAADPLAETRLDVTLKVQEVDRPPVLAPIGVLRARRGHPLTYTVRAHDPDGEPITLHAESLGPGMNFTPETGLLEVAPDVEFGEADVAFVAMTASKSFVEGKILQVEAPVDPCLEVVAVGSPTQARVTLHCPVEFDEPLAWIAGDPLSAFGAAVAVEDLDGDLLPDLLVGAPDAAAGAGRVYVFDGARLALGGAIGLEEALVLEGGPSARMGSSLAVVATHEGVRVLVGAPGEDSGYGLIAVADAVEMVYRPAIDDYLACGYLAEGCGAVMLAADLSGDGQDELVVGAPAGPRGEVDVFRGASVEDDGEPWLQLLDPEEGTHFGAALAAAQDGAEPVLLVGAPLATGAQGEVAAGRVRAIYLAPGDEPAVTWKDDRGRVGERGDHLGTSLTLQTAEGSPPFVWAGAPGCGKDCTGRVLGWPLGQASFKAPVGGPLPPVPVPVDRTLTGFLPGEGFGAQVLSLGSTLVVSSSDEWTLLPGAWYWIDADGALLSTATGLCEAEGFGLTLAGGEGGAASGPGAPVGFNKGCRAPYTTVNEGGPLDSLDQTPTPETSPTEANVSPGVGDEGCGCASNQSPSATAGGLLLLLLAPLGRLLARRRVRGWLALAAAGLVGCADPEAAPDTSWPEPAEEVAAARAPGATLQVPSQYSTIAAAVAAATSGDTIQVAAGTYTLSAAINFGGKTLVLEAPAGPTVTTLQGNGSTGLIELLSGEGQGTAVRGFTLKGGVANTTRVHGGAIYLAGPARLEVDNCVFDSNTSNPSANNTSGGAIYVTGANSTSTGQLTVTNSLFKSNWTSKGWGGAMYVAGYTTVTVRSSTLASSSAVNDGGFIFVQATVVSGNTNLTLDDVTLVGGSSANGKGGALAVTSGVVSVVRSRFFNNFAPLGGGAIWSNGQLTLKNTLISGNRAGLRGGGIFTGGGSATLNFNTFVENAASIEGGNLALVNTNPINAAHNVVAFSSGGEGIFVSGGSVASFTYNNVYGNHTANYAGMSSSLPNNLSLDPKLGAFEPGGTVLSNYSPPRHVPILSAVSDASRPYMLNNLVPASTSPMIGAGNPSASFNDTDGSRADLGFTGGPDADVDWHTDSDGDGLSDGYEQTVGSDPAVADAAADPDGDGASTLAEEAAATRPFHAGAYVAPELRVPQDYPTIQAAIDAATSNQTIKVACGTYDVSSGEITFKGKALKLIGAASGCTPATPESVLDGNGKQVVGLVSGEGAAALISGFTIREGSSNRASGAAVPGGGGIGVKYSRLTVESCKFTANVATYYGAAMSYLGASGAIRSSLFTGNGDPNYNALDGTIAVRDSSRVTIEDTEIANNRSGTSAAGVVGSGAASTLVVRRSYLHDNSVTTNCRGAAIKLDAGTLATVQNTLIVRNTCTLSGTTVLGTAGIYFGGGSGTLLARNNTLADNVVVGPASTGLYLTGNTWDVQNNLISHGVGGVGVYTASAPVATQLFKYNDVFANQVVDGVPHNYGGLLADQTGVNGNVSTSPRYARFVAGQTSSNSWVPAGNSPARDVRDAAEGFPDPAAPTDTDLGYTGGPFASLSFFTDTDSDGLTDGYEVSVGLNSTLAADAQQDLDGDGLVHLLEYQVGGDIRNADTDGDLVSDQVEYNAGTDVQSPDDYRPDADAGQDFRTQVGTLTQVQGVGTDPNGSPVTYQWTLTSVPSGSTLSSASLSGATTAMVSFTPDVIGFYTLQLVVSDGIQPSLPDSVTVQANGTANVPSTSWPTIQYAIDRLGDGDTITVAPGTYTGSLNLNGKALYIVSTGGPDVTTLNGNGARVLTVQSGEEAGTTLEGFTITGGRSGTDGGAIYVSGSHLTVKRCYFLENRATWSGAALYGINATLTVEQSRFVGNRTDTYHGTFAAKNSTNTLRKVQFMSNYARALGGAIYLEGGATVIEGALLLGNRGLNQGGAIYAQQGTLTAKNLALAGNVSGAWGGAMTVKSTSGVLSNLTSIDNSATNGGGNLFLSGTAFDVQGSIFAWSPQSSVLTENGSAATWAYNDVFGSTPLYAGTMPDPGSSQGNLKIDPQLAQHDTTTRIYRDRFALNTQSPLIDAGNPNAAWDDPDGSRNDLGVYGGPGAAGVDLDLDGVARGAGDCDDQDGDVRPGKAEFADGKDNNCDGQIDEQLATVDGDADGVSNAQGDCDDLLSSRKPGAAEKLNGVDDDCDGEIDEDTAASDDDGDGTSDVMGDCNDANPAIRPGGTEVCNGADDDCDGATDEGTTVNFYRDADGDSYGAANGSPTAACAATPPPGYVLSRDDCNDTSAAIHPGALEVADGVDNNCNGLVDEILIDADGDGYSPYSVPDPDCDDTNPDVAPGLPEGEPDPDHFGCAAADGLDNNCDGVVDEQTCGTDDDDDTFSELNGDCDDGRDDVYPGAPETWVGGIDHDCDGIVGPGAPDPDVSELSVLPDELPADGLTTALVTVVPRNEDGLLLGPDVGVLILTDLGTLVGEVFDHGDGTYSQELRAPVVGGVAQVSAIVEGVPLSTVASVVCVPDETAPQTRIVEGPAEGSATASPSVVFRWSGTDNSAAALSFSWRLDGAAWSDWATLTTTRLTGLTLGAHTFEVRARDVANNVDASPAVRNFTQAELPPEIFPTVDPEGSGLSLTLRWEGYNEQTEGGPVAYYRVFGSASPFTATSAATAVGTTSAGVQHLTVQGLARGQRYYLSVVAVLSGDVARTQITAPEAQVSAIPVDVEGPEPVSALRVESSSSSLTFRWSPPANGDHDLAGQRLTLSDGQQQSQIDLGPTADTYVVSSLPYASSRTAVVVGYDGEDPANVSDARSLTGVTLLNNPTGVQARPANQKVHLSWDAASPAQLMAGYNVYASTTPITSVAGRTPTLTRVQGTSATVSGLSNEVTYYLAVATVNLSGGVDPAVTAVSATPVADDQPPLLSRVTLAGVPVVDGTVITTRGTLEVVSSDADSGVARVEARLGGASLGVVTTPPYRFTLDPAAVPDGATSLYVAATDGRGNLAEQSYAVQVQLAVPPPPALTSPADGVEVLSAQVEVVGTTTPGTEVLVKVNGAVQQTVPSGTNGAFSVQVDLVEGGNTLSALARNRAGVSASSLSVQVVCDTQPPAAPQHLTATARAGGVIDLAWDSPSTGETPTGYLVYRAQAPIPSTAGLTPLTTAPLSLRAYSDTPTPVGTWHYVVVSVDEAGNPSPPSAGASATSDGTAPRLTSWTISSSGATNGDVLGVSQHVLTVTSSEPLLTTPYLSLVDGGGVPLNLTPPVAVGGTQYRSSFQVTAATTSGPLTLRWSGKDRTGNVGTAVDFSFPLVVDTRGPTGQIALNPGAPLQNDSAAPLTVAITLILDEAPAEGTTPTLKAATRYRTTVDTVPLTAGSSPLSWQGSYTLPSNVGTQPGDWLSFSMEVEDTLANAGALADPRVFEVFQGELPPAATPSGLSVRALPGGAAELRWTPVSGASAYEVYRAAHGQGTGSLVNRPTTTTWVDPGASAGLPEGTYAWSVASVRVENGFSSTGAPSTPVQATLDATAPDAPQGLAVELLPQGVSAVWEPLAGDDITYRLLRSEGGDLELATVVAEELLDAEAVDPSPSSLEPLYAVVAVDGVGNVSAPSEWIDAGFDHLPVRDVRVELEIGLAPQLSWDHESQALAGFRIGVVEGDEVIPLHDGLVTTYEWEDTAWSGGDRTWEIVAVDGDGEESLPRTVTLPALTPSLADGTQMLRGQIGHLATAVASTSPTAWDIAGVEVAYRDVIALSEGGSVPAQGEITREVVVGGDADLPDLLTLTVTALLLPEPGVEVAISQLAEVPVGEAVMPLEVHWEPLVKGADGRFSFVLTNSGPDPIQILTALDHDSPSDEVLLKLTDPSRQQVFGQVALAQRTGGVVRLPNGRYVAEIPAGGVFTSGPMVVPLPLSLPEELGVEVSISQLHTAAGSEGDLTARGPSAWAPASLDTLPWAAQVEEVGYVDLDGSFVAADHFRPGDTVHLRGHAWSTSQPDNPMPYASLKVWTQHEGSLSSIDVVSDLDGAFEVWFKPLGAGAYSAWAGHPEMTARPVQASFQLDALYVSPSLDTVQLGVGNTMTRTLTLTNAGAEVVEDVFVTVDSVIDTATNQAAQGITALVLASPMDLAPNAPAQVPVQISVATEAPAEVTLRLSVRDRGSDTAWTTARINLSTHDAQPSLATSPTSVSTGTNPGTSHTRYVAVTNEGYGLARGVSVALVPEVGQPLPSWITLSTPSSLGDMSVGSTQQVGLTFIPGATVPDGVYKARLNVSSTNTPQASVPVSVTVTSGTTGNGFVHLVDAWYDEAAGIYGVNGATVTLRHSTIPTLSFTASTGADNLGLASFEAVPAARYSFYATAPGHTDVSGTLEVRPGVDSSVEAIMELATLSYSWTVTETTVEDSYTVTLEAEYQTDVPVPVIVIEPAGIELPQMDVGDEIFVDYHITNYGLIRGEDFVFTLPTGDPEYVFTLLTPLPDAIEARQQLVARVSILKVAGGSSGSGGDDSGGEDGTGVPGGGDTGGGDTGGDDGGGDDGGGDDGGGGGGSSGSTGTPACTLAVTARAKYCSCPLYCTRGPNATFSSSSQVRVPRSCPNGGSSGGGGNPVDPGGTAVGGGGAGGSTQITKCLYLYLDIPWCEDNSESHSTVNLSSGRYEDWIQDLKVEAAGPDLEIRRGYTGVAPSGAPLGPGWHLWRILDHAYKTSTEPELPYSIYQGTEELTAGPSLARFADEGRLRCAGPDAACQMGSACSGSRSKLIGMCSDENIAMEEDQQQGGFKLGAPSGRSAEDDGTALTFTQADLTPDANLAITLMDSRGSMKVYGPLNSTGVQYPLWGPENARVEILSDGQGQMAGALQRFPDGGWRKFDVGGYIVATGDAVGNVVDYLYDEEGRLQRLQSRRDPSRFIELEFEGSGPHLNAARDGRGRRVEYHFDQGGRLGGVTDVFGESFGYTYNGKDHLVTKTRPEGEVVQITYAGDHGQVASVALRDTNGAELLGKTYTRFFDEDGNSVIRVTTSEGRWHEVVQTIYGQTAEVKDADGVVLTRSYDYFDDQGTVRSVTETRRDGGTWETWLDTMGRTTRRVDPYGATWRFTYPGDWSAGVTQPSRIEAPDGTLIDAERDARGLITRLVMAAGTEDELVHRFEWDEDGNLTAQYLPGDADGDPTWAWSWDAGGNLLSYTEVLDSATQVTWTLSHSWTQDGHHIATVTDPNGQRWVLDYDQGERLTEVRDGLTEEVTLRYEYDGDGRRVREIQWPDDPTSKLTRQTTYRVERLVAQVTRAVELGEEPTRYTWDDDGHLTQEIDPLDRATHYDLDELGRVFHLTDPSGGDFLLGYDEGTTACQNCSGGERQTEISTVTDPLGGRVTTTYDLKGRAIAVEDQAGDLTELEYDLLDRIVRRTEPDGTVVHLSWNRRGQLTAVTREEPLTLRTTLLEYDARGQLTAVYDGADPTQPLYAYERYRNGWVQVQSYAAGNSQTVRYDSHGDPFEITQSDGSQILSTFGPRHDLLSSSFYDADGLLTHRVSYQYDDHGRYVGWTDRLDAADEDFHSQVLERDRLGRVTRVTTTWPGGVTRSFRQTWTDTDKLATWESPDGDLYTYGYSSMDTLASVSGPGLGAGIRVSRFDWRYPAQIAFPDGSQLERTYGLDGRLMGQELSRQGELRLSEDYERGPMGRLEEATLLTGQRSWAYDGSGALAAEEGAAQAREYTWDQSALVNRLSSTEDPEEWQYGPGGALLSRGEISYTYDAMGRPTERYEGGQLVHTYVWSVEGRLLRVEDAEGEPTAEYTYDPFGQRMSKTTAAGTTLLLYHGGSLLGEYSATGQTLRSWVNLRGMEATFGPIAAQGAQTLMGVLDARGAPLSFHDMTGAQRWQGRHAAFGEREQSQGDFDPPQRLAGQYADPETGLSYNLARYYVPEEGRYLTPDPMGLASSQLSAYLYVGGDPINGADPLGLFTLRDALDFAKLKTVGGTIGLEVNGLGGSVTVYTDGHRWKLCLSGGRGVQTAPLIEFNPDLPRNSTSLAAGAEVGLGLAAAGLEGSATYYWDQQCIEPSLEAYIDSGPLSLDLLDMGSGPSWSASHTDEWSHDHEISLSLTLTHCF